MAETKKYKLKEVCIRLAEGHLLYSDVPLSSPAAALDVMRKELAQLDREVLCVVNLNAKLKPINFNIVSMGSINYSVAAIPNILKSGILSNACGFLLLHNHPSGDLTPSKDDLRMTKRCIEAGKLMDIPCLDHIIVGGSNGDYRSMREESDADFVGKMVYLTAEQIMSVNEDQTKIGEKAGKGATNMANETRMGLPDEQVKREEVTLKFGKGLAEPFTSKDGKEFIRIAIPNQDSNDKTPWASFVLPAKAVHENQYGKGLWAKVPADGTTTVTKPVLQGQDPDGKNIWQDMKTEVPNAELKAMVESYKSKAPHDKAKETRESTKAKLDTMIKETAQKLSMDNPKRAPRKAKGPEL